MVHWLTSSSSSMRARLSWLRLAAALLGIALALLVVQAAYADSIQVTTPDDVVDANGGDCDDLAPNDLPGPDALVSLREALCAANTNPEPDTILLLAETYVITQTGVGDDWNVAGDFDILAEGGDLTISGMGAISTTIDGNGFVTGDRVFDVPPSSDGPITLTISGLTIAFGALPDVPGSLGGGFYVQDAHNVRILNCDFYENTARQGGAIFTMRANLVISQSLLFYNKAYEDGGGIYHDIGGGLVTIHDSTLRGNQATGPAEVVGGAIYNAGSDIRITLSSVISNSAECTIGRGIGGGIYSWDGTIELSTSYVSYNSAIGQDDSGYGGGIAIRAGTLIISDTTIDGNKALSKGGGEGSGGGINCSDGIVTITHSEVSENHSNGPGGGFYVNGASLVMTNTTVSGNLADGSGGGIYNQVGKVQLDHVTISGNVADNNATDSYGGGGIAHNGKPVELKNTIVAGNIDRSPTPANKHPDCQEHTTSHGNNLIGDQTGCETTAWLASDQVGGGGSPPIDPLLSPLADNGSSTWTHALRAGSPALNAATCTDMAGKTVYYDQRYWRRPAGGACDIGAFEAAPSLHITKTVAPAQVSRHGTVTYTIVVSNSGLVGASSVIVSDTLPAKVDFGRWLPGEQPAGATVAGRIVTWTGSVPTGQKVTFSFEVNHTGDSGDVVTNTAQCDHESGSFWADARFKVGSGYAAYLPIVLKDHKP